MRKVTAGLFYSIDGVAEAPDQFQFDSFDDELGMMLGAVMERVDTVLMGRVGYEEWAGYWPTAEQDEGFARFINSVPKFVASRTLKGSLDWQNSTLVADDLEAFVRDLKGKPGGEIAVMGGMSLVRQLLLAGLMDEMTLIVHPVIAGTGRRLFEDGTPTTRLELKESTRTSKGNMVLTYGPRADLSGKGRERSRPQFHVLTTQLSKSRPLARHCHIPAIQGDVPCPCPPFATSEP
ncbi:dihydrofolate reductase family protein [Devosia nitrariae]|uniref:Deaminase reductase n=1 Tax=Devosia nitrariae TaxID=2071872 RepID=A0ABQ5W3C0_9HYPH|nr:dihydrofolate reductase family protein [Devosia nitrariae]GLQ54420.1 deaminase reductase [Devosia nitrariae]